MHLIAFHPTVNGEAHLVGNGEPKYSVNRKYRGALWKNYREGKGALRDKIILPSDSSILPAASRFGTEDIIRSDPWSTGKKSTVLHVTFVDKNQLQKNLPTPTMNLVGLAVCRSSGGVFITIAWWPLR